MDSICRKLVRGVGFSKGWALLALKKPPPLVPSILMASCDATGPCAMVWVVTVVVVLPSAPVVTVCGSSSFAVSYGRRFCTTPCETSASAKTVEIGSRTHRVPRVRSTQKLPSVFISVRAMPRIKAMASARPTAADQKLCVASPSIWVRVAHGRLGRVGLPVGVGGEGDGGVPGEVRRDAGRCCGFRAAGAAGAARRR